MMTAWIYTGTGSSCFTHWKAQFQVQVRCGIAGGLRLCRGSLTVNSGDQTWARLAAAELELDSPEIGSPAVTVTRF